MFNAVCFVNTLEGPEEEKHSLSGYLLKIKNLNWIELNSRPATGGLTLWSTLCLISTYSLKHTRSKNSLKCFKIRE